MSNHQQPQGFTPDRGEQTAPEPIDELHDFGECMLPSGYFSRINSLRIKK